MAFFAAVIGQQGSSVTVTRTITSSTTTLNQKDNGVITITGAAPTSTMTIGTPTSIIASTAINTGLTTSGTFVTTTTVGASPTNSSIIYNSSGGLSKGVVITIAIFAVLVSFAILLILLRGTGYGHARMQNTPFRAMTGMLYGDQRARNAIIVRAGQKPSRIITHNPDGTITETIVDPNNPANPSRVITTTPDANGGTQVTTGQGATVVTPNVGQGNVQRPGFFSRIMGRFGGNRRYQDPYYDYRPPMGQMPYGDFGPMGGPMGGSMVGPMGGPMGYNTYPMYGGGGGYGMGPHRGGAAAALAAAEGRYGGGYGGGYGGYGPGSRYDEGYDDEDDGSGDESMRYSARYGRRPYIGGYGPGPGIYGPGGGYGYGY